MPPSYKTAASYQSLLAQLKTGTKHCSRPHKKYMGNQVMITRNFISLYYIINLVPNIILYFIKKYKGFCGFFVNDEQTVYLRIVRDSGMVILAYCQIFWAGYTSVLSKILGGLYLRIVGDFGMVILAYCRKLYYNI